MNPTTNWQEAFARYEAVMARARAISNARYTRKWRISLYYARKSGCHSVHLCRNWGVELPGEAGEFARKAIAYFEQALAHGQVYDRVARLAHNKFMVPAGAARLEVLS